MVSAEQPETIHLGQGEEAEEGTSKGRGGAGETGFKWGNVDAPQCLVV